MNDQISINEFHVLCKIGITPAERAQPQELILNMKLFLSLLEAGQTDDLSKTLDYAKLLEFLNSFLKNREFNLIESVAENCARTILQKFPLKSIEIEVTKKPFSNPKSLSIKIFRENK